MTLLIHFLKFNILLDRAEGSALFPLQNYSKIHKGLSVLNRNAQL